MRSSSPSRAFDSENIRKRFRYINGRSLTFASGSRSVQNSCFAAMKQRIAKFAVSERSGVRNEHRPTKLWHRRAVEIDPYNCAANRRVQRDRFG